jgi:hypothetical protein
MTAAEKVLNFLVSQLGIEVVCDPYDEERFSIEVECHSSSIDEEAYELLKEFLPSKEVR